MQAVLDSLPSSPDRQQADSQFARRIGYVKHVIGRLCYVYDVSDDDVADNALCWAWQRFAETAPPMLAIETPRGEIVGPNWLLHCWRGARFGFHRALRGTQWAGDRRQGYVDAMDRSSRQLFASAPIEASFGRLNQTDVDDLVSRLPDNLRLIYEALIVGFTQQEIADMQDISVATINTRIGELRIFVRALLRC